MLKSEVVLVVTCLVGLLIWSCQCQSKKKPKPMCPEPGKLASIDQCCNTHLGTQCDPEQSTKCIALDENRPHEGKCGCADGFTFDYPFIHAIYTTVIRPDPMDKTKVLPQRRPTEAETMTPDFQRWRQQLSKKFCVPYRARKEPCKPIEGPNPDSRIFEYYAPRFYVFTEAEIPSSEFPKFENQGCQEYLTDMYCNGTFYDMTLAPDGRCFCPEIPKTAADYEDNDILQLETGKCGKEKLSYAGQKCKRTTKLICWTSPDDREHLICGGEGATATEGRGRCVCPDPKQDYFPVGKEIWEVKCATTIGFGGECDKKNHPSGWCAWRQDLECDAKQRKCICKDKAKTWSSSQSKCLLQEGKACEKDKENKPKHKDCVTKFCNPSKICARQVGRSQPCPSGMHEQCSTAFCHPKRKTCEFNTTEVTQSNEPRLQPKVWSQLALLLGSAISALCLLCSK